ncbi:hypothetical protein OU798_24650 [Prolixibacteraceae bacterium Z1-6]|uniref:Uncharacterized protein n=1 Tax=Draconibacterium aestuarii TaxID=2998507 RepID=A0A9X3FAE3_9BACT|nr:hypothetical protein [Prolixibacteraceae bacterium Z1-6]
MKQLILVFTFCLFTQINLKAQEESAYFLVGTGAMDMHIAIQSSKDALSASGFKVIGEYNPGNSNNLAVICYTSPELEKIALGFKDRGALAATLKIGFKKDGDQVKISMINPIYLFYAYFIDGIDKQEAALAEISEKAKNAMKKVGTDFTPFGGTLDKAKLQKYHYKVMMPYFEDAEELNEFSSFGEGVKIIQENLQKGKGETAQVYKRIYTNEKVAVFGVALKNTETGEANFLPIVGDDHVAAMPYEIILQENTASILPGKYRIALHWPELTMGTFMKIMSTPGDIKDTMKSLTE